MVIPYNIWIGSYYHMSGGIRALHVLRDELLARGIDAAMTYERQIPNSIVVYPEIVQGDPMQAGSYVKWLLNKAHFPDEPCWAWDSQMGDYPTLTVEIIERDLFRPSDGPREGACYWVGKGELDESVLPPDAQEISRFNMFTRKEVADALRSSEYLISFDPFTCVNLEAVLCGTPVLIHSRNNQWSRAEIEGSGWLKYGCAWSPEQLPSARESVVLARDNYEEMVKGYPRLIDGFVEATQEMFG